MICILLIVLPLGNQPVNWFGDFVSRVYSIIYINIYYHCARDHQSARDSSPREITSQKVALLSSYNINDTEGKLPSPPLPPLLLPPPLPPQPPATPRPAPYSSEELRPGTASVRSAARIHSCHERRQAGESVR